jgi:hypothetical protein
LILAMLAPPSKAAPGRRDYEPAFLPSSGYGDGRATLHIFDRREEVPAEQLKLAQEHKPRGAQRPGIALIYKCTETGAEKRWGLERASEDDE